MTESLPFWVHLFRVVAAFGLFLVSTAMLIWGERRLVARMQSRIGPNRVGPFGILQTLVDGVKLFFKEDIRPSMVDVGVYIAAPFISVVVAFMSIAIIPFGGEVTLWGETFELQVIDLNVGVLWFLAMGSINVYGIVLAGWASHSAYPLLGAVRSTAQMISYEIAQGLAVASVFVWAGTLQVSEIVRQQAADTGLLTGVPNFFAIPLFPAFIIFFIAVIAETQRPPFDLPEAEGELVAGFHTEYSGMKFAMFFLAEFMNVITVSAIVVTLFFGGPSGPTFGLPAGIAWIMPIVWFMLKTFIFVFIFVLLRASMPRFKYDRLMTFGWKYLLPIGLLWVIATGFMVLVNEQVDQNGRMRIAVGGVVVAAIIFFLAPLFGRDDDEPVGADPVPLDPATSSDKVAV